MTSQTPALVTKTLGTAHVVDVEITDDEIIVTLSDGRRISNPLSWHWWLAEATQEERAGFEIYPTTVLWPSLKEGLDVEGMLRGIQPRKMA